MEPSIDYLEREISGDVGEDQIWDGIRTSIMDPGRFLGKKNITIMKYSLGVSKLGVI